MVQLRNSADRYGVVTKTLHWATVLLILVQFTSGFTGSVEDDVHGTIGLTLLVLVGLRLLWRWTTPLPDWAPTLTKGERVLSHWNERLLYLAIIAKSVTGLFYISADGDELEVPIYGEMPATWPQSEYWEDFFEAAHALSGYVLLAAIAIHVGLVLKHQFLQGDRFANRMLPFTRQ